MLIEVFLQVLVYVCAFLVLVYIDKTDRPTTDLGKSSVTVRSYLAFFFFQISNLGR